MPELFKDNAYPLLMFHATLPPSNALDEKKKEEMVRAGYQESYMRREYPLHVPTGEFTEILNADGGITKRAVTVVVQNKREHDDLLAMWKTERDEAAAQKAASLTETEAPEKPAPRRGRPPKPVETELQTA